MKTSIISLYLLTFYLHISNVFGQDSLSIVKEPSFNNKNNVYKHHVGIEFRPSFVLPSSPFYQGYDNNDLKVKNSFSGHLKYIFTLPSETLGHQVFPNTHQGLGLAYFDFGHTQEYGKPIATYLFQNAEITHFNKSLSLAYEWNFGLSTGWRPYDPERNPRNLVVGSRENAYINLGLFFKWRFLERWLFTSGIDLTHFSNGNTEYPNAGVNTVGARVGVIYDVYSDANEPDKQRLDKTVAPFPRHISYDVVVFGSWRRKGVYSFGSQIASPHKYPVIGGYFATMYNLGYRFRTGVSADVIYDGSANVYTKDYIIGTPQQFFQPAWNRQVALGLSARGEYVMPIFTIGVGLGTNVLHAGGDLRGSYQSFVLKIGTSKNSFLHIGYNLKDFHDPNYLMLGIGYRFNNKTPSLWSR